MMGDKLKPVQSPKGDAFTMIVKYLTGDTAVQLTADAERMMKRLMFADALFRTNKKTSDEICTELQNTFSISEFTALKDIKNAQKLFAQARQINKTYLAHLHLERINKDIEELRDRLFWYEDDEMPGVKKSRMPDAKELMALAKLHDAYNYTLNSAPEEKRKETLPAPVFNFVLVKGTQIQTSMSVQDALAAADDYISGPATPLALPEIEDVDFEESKDTDDQDDQDDN